MPPSTAFARLLLGTAFALCALTAQAAPQPYTATYDVLRNGSLLGRGTVSLQAAPSEDNHWLFRTDTRGTEGLAGLAAAQISEQSTLRWDARGPETRDYRFRQSTAFSKSRERSVQIDAAAGRIVSRDKNGEHVFPYQTGVLDRHAVTLALMQDVAAGKRGELRYPVVDRARLEQQRFRIGAIETVATPGGPRQAVKVERIRDSAEGRTTTVWLGVDNGFVPVKVLQDEDDGERFEMRLIAVQR